MPNWVHAGFNVTGDRSELQRFERMMIRPRSEVGMPCYADFPTPRRSVRPGANTSEGRKLTFDFNGIIPMPPERECPNWEAWAVDNWGTKWNAQEVSTKTKPDNIWFQFSTPWDFPTPVFEALANEFPMLVFAGSAYWEDKSAFTGEFNGNDDWGPGEIEWAIDTSADEDEDEPPA